MFTAWFLVVITASGVTYSPPLTSLDECGKLQKETLKVSLNYRSTCMQLNIQKP